MSQVLVTGASGFIASHIIHQLLEKNYKVVGTIRSLKKQEILIESLKKITSKTANLSFVEADLNDSEEKWKEIVQGNDYIMHVASPFPNAVPKNDDELIIPAKQGTLKVLKVATDLKLKKVVLTSSTAACLYGVRKNGIFNEENWTDPTNLEDTTPYFRSKAIAEKAAWDFVKNNPNSVALTTVLPGFVLGPIIFKSFGTSVGVVNSILNAKYPALPKIGYPSVDVRSVADLHIKAMESEKADGKRFCAVDSYLTFKQIAEILKEKYPNRKIPQAELPDFVVRFLAIFDKTLKSVLIDLQTQREASSARAKEILNWQSIPMKTSVLDCAKSLEEIGFVN